MRSVNQFELYAELLKNDIVRFYAVTEVSIRISIAIRVTWFYWVSYSLKEKRPRVQFSMDRISFRKQSKFFFLKNIE